MTTSNQNTQSQSGSGRNPISFIFYGLALLVTIFAVYYWYSNSESKSRNASGSVQPDQTFYEKDTVVFVKSEIYELKKGEVKRVPIEPFEHCYCSGGGKKYYRQPQNGEKVLQGGGLPFQSTEYSAYIDLSSDEEEITVVCTFYKTIKKKVFI